MTTPAKISDEIVEKALEAFYGKPMSEWADEAMRAALEAVWPKFDVLDIFGFEVRYDDHLLDPRKVTLTRIGRTALNLTVDGIEELLAVLYHVAHTDQSTTLSSIRSKLEAMR